ncbi:hypothetical protein PInf_011869 [Phytophthora infestans]|nr:hypothetical protein PInf_011869 [Phytophthora infestans]
MFIPYDNAIPKHAAKFVRIVRGVATHISADTNEVSYHAIGSNDKESEATSKLKFDYLVLATGSSYSVPIKPDSRDHARSATELKLQEVRGHIEKAERILVVGGGAVGCEVAAEVMAKYPNKSVTIVDANKQLIAGNNLRDKSTHRLTGNCFETRTLRTDKGTEITSDIQLLCGGFSPVSTLVQEMNLSLVTDRGFVKVNDKLQLEDTKYAHVFALGDMCNHPTPKMAIWAGEQASFLAGELTAVIREKQTGFINPFAGVAVEAMILPLGPSGGVSQLPMFGGIVLRDWFTRLIKSRDYLAGRIWASIGASVPINN